MRHGDVFVKCPSLAPLVMEKWMFDRHVILFFFDNFWKFLITNNKNKIKLMLSISKKNNERKRGFDAARYL
jgi:hypothetical protein